MASLSQSMRQYGEKEPQIAESAISRYISRCRSCDREVARMQRDSRRSPRAVVRVTTKALVQATKRNRARFPPDFMFQLTVVELEHLRSQTVTSSAWGGRRTPPYAFTEQGIAMLSGVLRSARAVRVDVEIMRAFVRLRRMLESHMDLARKIKALEAKYDSQFAVVFEAIRELMAPPARPAKQIGFER